MTTPAKPVLPQGSLQSTAPQTSKPLHSQGPATYGQPQNLVSMQHGMPSPAHNSATVQNHYVLNTPYQHSPYFISPPKSPFASNVQPNLASYAPQSVPAPPQVPPPEPLEKPHSNGSSEAQGHQNHTVDQKEVSDVEKQETPITPVSNLTDENSSEEKQEDNAPDMHDSSSSVSVEDTEVGTCNSNSKTNTEEADVPTESANFSETPAKGNGTEEAKNDDAQGAATAVESAITPADTLDSANTHTNEQSQTTFQNLPKANAPKTPPKKQKASDTDTTDPPKATKPDKPVTPKSTARRVVRARTIREPYQYPLHEMSIPTPKKKESEEKLIIFYKKEYLALRNVENDFFVCQALQNIYRTSSKIRIRWLSKESEDDKGELYTQSYYTTTDRECILTNINLTSEGKTKFRLPPTERKRTLSILQRSLAVEKGETAPASPTEEHPDGLDLSLYKEEGQLQRQKTPKRKPVPTPKPLKPPPAKKAKMPKPAVEKKLKVATSSKTTLRKSNDRNSVGKTAASLSTGRTERAKRRAETTSAPTVDPSPPKKTKKVIPTKKILVTVPQPQIPKRKQSSQGATKVPKSTKTTGKKGKVEAVPARKPMRTRSTKHNKEEGEQAN